MRLQKRMISSGRGLSRYVGGSVTSYITNMVLLESWEALMSGPKVTFTEGNYRAFFGMAIDMLVKPWEKMLGIMRFSEVRNLLDIRDEANLRM